MGGLTQLCELFKCLKGIIDKFSIKDVDRVIASLKADENKTDEPGGTDG